MTFALGVSSAAVLRFRPVPAVKVHSWSAVTNINAQLPPGHNVEDVQPTHEVDKVMRPHPVTISPYEIKRLIVENNLAARRQRWNDLDLAPIWRQLGISPKDTGILSIYKCNGNCEANISILELDGEPGKETILGVGVAGNLYYRYLVFKQANIRRGSVSAWIFIGYIDGYSRWSEPAFRVVTAGPDRWLAIGSVSGHGSAFGSSAEHWYAVCDDGVAPVFSYQSGLFVGFRNPSIDRTTNLVSSEHRNGISVIVLQSSTSYEGHTEFADPFPVWRTKRKATFIKGPRMAHFIFDPFHSEMTAEELDPFYEHATVSNKDFLEYNYRELLEIASERHTRRKDWLIDFLKSFDDSVEKRSLLETAIMNDKCRF